MNWRLSRLDNFTLVSNSDLHSCDNLARNATVFHCSPDFYAMRRALEDKDPSACGGTVDLFPEEGKYHLDGHRKCGVCLEPEDSLARDNRCPVCGQPLVLGVLHRVVALADREKGACPASALPCDYIIPLAELLSELHGCGPKTKKVSRDYERLLKNYGPEMSILRSASLEELENDQLRLLPEAVRRVRNNDVIREAGYDGKYGVISVFDEGEKDQLLSQGVFAGIESFARQNDTAPPAASWKNRETERTVDAADAGYLFEQDLYQTFAETPGDDDNGLASAAVCESPGADAQNAGRGEGAVLDGLTQEQAGAVQSTEAAVMIVAGPGTGKTRTLTRRIARMIEDGAAAPQQILALTFTNRAAGEMNERLADLLGSKARDVFAGTFHRLALKLLRTYAPDCWGWHAAFGIVDQERMTEWLRSDCGFAARDAEQIVERLGYCWRQAEEPVHEDGYAEVNRMMRATGTVPLDALLYRAAELLEQTAPASHELAGCHLFVDEYQDLNRVQYNLVRLLGARSGSLTVIGDPDQAIYGFRGADMRFFLQFSEDYPAAGIYNLTGNYRSVPSVIGAGDKVIEPGRTDLSTAAYSKRQADMPVRISEAPTAEAEAEFIAHEIERLVGGTALFSLDSDRVDTSVVGQTGFGDIAVLVRLKSLMPPLAEALHRLGVPVQEIGRSPRGIGQETRKALDLLERYRTAAPDEPAVTVLNRVLPEAADAETTQGLKELGRSAADWGGTLTGFLDEWALKAAPDAYDGAAEKVTVTTLHAAKGLEFPVVFMAACEEGILPYRRISEDVDIEEERRLAYVGMTRAENLLYITWARGRQVYGAERQPRLSRFMETIPDAYKLTVPHEPPTKSKNNTVQLEFDF